MEYYLATADSVGRRDWIKEYEARVEHDRRIGNTVGYANNQVILSLLNNRRCWFCN